jgi:hypothetical protein
VNQVRTIGREPFFVVGPSNSLGDGPPFLQAEEPEPWRYRRRPRGLCLLAGGLPRLWTWRHRLRVFFGGLLPRLARPRSALLPGSLRLICKHWRHRPHRHRRIPQQRENG